MISEATRLLIGILYIIFAVGALLIFFSGGGPVFDKRGRRAPKRGGRNAKPSEIEDNIARIFDDLRNDISEIGRELSADIEEMCSDICKFANGLETKGAEHGGADTVINDNDERGKLGDTGKINGGDPPLFTGGLREGVRQMRRSGSLPQGSVLEDGTARRKGVSYVRGLREADRSKQLRVRRGEGFGKVRHVRAPLHTEESGHGKGGERSAPGRELDGYLCSPRGRHNGVRRGGVYIRLTSKRSASRRRPGDDVR